MAKDGWRTVEDIQQDNIRAGMPGPRMLTDREYAEWCRDAVSRDIRTGLLNISSSDERQRLFDTLQRLLDRMKMNPEAPGADRLKRFDR
jgi:hypothetical protein